MPDRTLADADRLAALRDLAILDTLPETDYDDLATIAAAICHSPVAAVNFVDDKRHFTKAIVGMPGAEGGSVSNDVSFCAATVESPDGVLIVPDTGADERWRDHPLVIGGPRVGFYAGVSILSRDQRVGVVCAFGDEPRELTDEQAVALRTLARQAGATLELRRRNAELSRLAVTDPLTGLGNRTLLFDRLELALADARRTGALVGILFCDLDGFKRVNDRFGHAAGDRLLRDVADHLRGAVREGDTVARIAGDEFVVICPGLAAPEDLDALVERLSATSPADALPDGRRAPRLSVGAAVARGGEPAADVIRRADVAMYGVKAARAADRLATV